ncbi:MAG: hypothetical protein QM778_15490 [Myxococcales bacterium]
MLQPRLGLPLALCLVSCIQIGPQDKKDDDSSSSTPAPFAGTWTYAEPLAPCSHFLIFLKREDVDSYEIDLACNLANGGVGMQVESGEFVLDEDGVTMFMPTRATCTSGLVTPHTDTVVQNGELQLSVKNAAGVVQAYDRVSSTGLGPSTTLGCFSSDGSFTPSSLTQL